MATSLKAQEVLDSLIGVLQSQADQLPPIHARLGLPHEALEEDLNQLRQQLETTITKLVERRRVEVNEWERRCHAAERDCSALGKCLGGGIGVDEEFLSLVHSEPVLPTRHTMILELQQELQKTYIARLDQRNHLARVLAAQERILGPEFHSSKHAQPFPTATEYDKDGQVVRRTITHEKLAELETQIERGKAEISKRVTELCVVLADFLQLHVDLGLDLPSETDPLADTSLVITTEDETQVFPCASPSRPGGGIRSKYQPGTQDYYDSIFAQYVAAVTLTGDPSPEAVELKGIEPTRDVFEYFRNRLAEMEPERTRREARVQVMFDELEMLWTRLSMPENYADEFSMKHTGVSDATLQAYEQELADMQEKRRAHLPHYTQMAREQIVRIWDELMVGPNERAKFCGMYEDEFTEELLTAHEQHVQRLKAEWTAKASLLEGVHKFMRVMEDETTLVQMSKDPARLAGKGGILLKEEKLRKRINRDKPKLERELRPAILAWEQANGAQFTINDVRFLDTMSAPKSEPESKPRPRSTVPPRGMTPAPTTGQKHAMAPASNASAKRVKLGSSTTSSQRGITPTPAKLGPASAPAGRSRGMGFTTPLASTSHVVSTSARHPLQTSVALNNHARAPAQLSSNKHNTPATASSSTGLPQPSRLATTGPKSGFGYGGGIGLGLPPKSPQRQPSSISNASDGSMSSSSTIRLVSGASSSSMSGSTLRTFSAGSFRTASGIDVASLVLAKGRRGSFKPRPSFHSDLTLPLPLQNMADQSRNWTVVREESDEDDDFGGSS